MNLNHARMPIPPRVHGAESGERSQDLDITNVAHYHCANPAWWTLRDLNSLPRRCERRVLPDELKARVATGGEWAPQPPMYNNRALCLSTHF